jgi:hypothetical protein
LLYLIKNLLISPLSAFYSPVWMPLIRRLGCFVSGSSH